jgi:hypothetical protein
VVDEALAQKYPFLKVGEPYPKVYFITLTPEQQKLPIKSIVAPNSVVLKTTYNLYDAK